MRKISSSLSEKLHRNIQTRANKSAPSASLWVGRPTTTLTSDQFLERQTVVSGSVTDVSIAVCHPKVRAGNTRVCIGYISDGVAKVVTAAHKYTMDDHVWVDTGFNEAASAISVAYDGTMPKSDAGDVEFVTEQKPWVFWVTGGALYGRKLGGESILLTETNCTDVSAIRATWSSVGSFDFGLIVFFLLNGKIYYRQLIDGEWMDAEVVSFGPADVTWEEISAFRTWDYRVGVQAKSTDGSVYEMFTQYMGVAKQNTEHVEIRGIKADGNLTAIQYTDTSVGAEHVEVSDISAGAPYGGLYDIASPVLTAAYNVENADGDWGKTIIAEFDIHLDAETVSSNANSFTLIDSNGNVYMASSASLDDETAKVVTLGFTDFNVAVGVCQLIYTPGSIMSLADTSMEQTQVSFTPENLTPPEVDPPVPVRAWNLDSEGTEVAIEFTEALTGDPNGNEDKLTVTTQEYDMVPDGTLYEQSKTVIGLKGYTSVEETLDLSAGTFDGISYSGSMIQLSTQGGD